MTPSRGRLALAFAVLPPAQALLAYVLFPLLWEQMRTFGPHEVERLAARMAMVTAAVGLLLTLAAAPVVLSLLRRGQATLSRLLIIGLALGNLPFSIYLGLIVKATLLHLIRGTLGNHMVPVPDLLLAVLRAVAIGSTFGVFSAGLFWIIGVRQHARPAALTGVLICALAMMSGEAGEAQAPDRTWGVTAVKPREVSRIYWDLLQTTEVLVALIPVGPDGKPLRIHLVVQAFFPGRETREWNTGRPQWPKGPPARLVITAQAFPLTFVIPELSLRLLIDGVSVDLTAPGGRHRNIPCLIAAEDCTPNGVEADLEPHVLRSLIEARSVQGEALGFPFELTTADVVALREFAARIQIAAGSLSDRQ